MSELVPATANSLDDPSDHVPRDDTPVNLRPNLEELGIIEIERGVCEDIFENRKILRQNKLQWDPVFDANGVPTGLLSVRSKESERERRLLSLAEKRPILVNPKDNNSDYVQGLDLLVDESYTELVPAWVIGATRAWVAEQENGGPKGKRAPAGLPNRCRAVKTDGLRCMLWSSGREKDDGYCRIHLGIIRRPGESVERARLKLAQAAPYAVDMLEHLMENAESEPVRLKASTEILDRAGVKGGFDFKVDVEVTDIRPAHEVIAERLNRLAAGAEAVLAAAARAEMEIEDGEVVSSDEA